MEIKDLPFSESVISTLSSMGISSLYPPQEEALKHVFKGRNMVLSVPTASGKSLVAYLAILRGLAAGGKGLYIVPLRALATEKYEDMKALLPKGYRAVLSIGDYDESDKRIMNHDVIIATSEKADSLFRHRPDFLKDFSVVVADEVHLITVPERGHILEVLLTRLKQMKPETQIVALSATIPNSQEIADWLQAAHLKSEWRPVSLREGVFHRGTIHFEEEQREIGKGDSVRNLVRDALDSGGQCLVFVNTRRSSETEARRLITAVSRYTNTQKLSEIADLLVSTQTEETDLVAKLANCVQGGTGFHHAGLGNTQRKIVEKAFKSGFIKVIVATPTLAAGINLPARRVVIRDLNRYTGRHTGNRPIANLELKQMAGRAGRPGYDPYGEAIYIVKKAEDVERLFSEVIHGETERIESKLGVAPTLRIHIISSIASGFVHDYGELLEFLNHTFYAHQFSLRQAEIREAIRFLQDNGMLISSMDKVVGTNEAGTKEAGKKEVGTGEVGKKEGMIEAIGEFVSADKLSREPGITGEPIDDRFARGDEARTEDRTGEMIKLATHEAEEGGGSMELRVTPFGKLTSDLYIDPKSAVIMKKAMERSRDKFATPLSYLHTIASTPDMLTLYVREGEMGDLHMMTELYQDELFLSPKDREIYGANQELAHELFAEELKTALLLRKWVDEVPENTIARSFNIGPGDLRNKVDTAQWLLHALERIAALFHHEHHELTTLLRRIQYGVKEELLPLTAMKGIGRVRARLLFENGYRDVGQLKRADVEVLIGIEGIGKATVFSIMEQLGRELPEYHEADREIKKQQRSLQDFGIEE